MAFIDQVQDLTSLTVSDNDELSQFLKDGVIDVTSRWLLVRPQDISIFSRESAETTSNGSLDINGAQIISVIRENGTNNQWRACRQIFPAEQYDVTDTESLSYASKYNPAFMIGDNGQISVFPTPSSTTDAFKVYHVNNVPVDKSGTALIHSHSDIGYFADDKVYLVVMYAGIKLIHATLAAKSAPSVPVSQVLPTLNITATDPTAISLTTISYLPVTATTSTALTSLTAPTYTKPTIVLGAAPTISDLSITAILPVVPIISSQAISDPSSFAPAYTKPTLTLGTAPTISNLTISAVSPSSPSSPSFTAPDISVYFNPASSPPAYTAPTIVLGTAPTISDLSISAVSPITPSLTSVTFTSIDSALDANTPVFSTATIGAASTYTGSVPTYTKPTLVLGSAPTISNLSITAVPPDTPTLSSSSVTITGVAPTYDASVATSAITEVNDFIDSDEDVELANAKIAEIQVKMQDELNAFNDANIEYQAILQKDLKDADIDNQEDARLLQKYQAELGLYQAEIGAQVQEYHLMIFLKVDL